MHINNNHTTMHTHLYSSREYKVSKNISGQVDRVKRKSVVTKIHDQPVEREDSRGEGHTLARYQGKDAHGLLRLMGSS